MPAKAETPKGPEVKQENIDHLRADRVQEMFDKNAKDGWVFHSFVLGSRIGHYFFTREQ